MSYSSGKDSAPAPFESRNFNLLWFGEGVSIYGTATTGIVLPLFAISQLHAGPSWMGLLTAATWLPWLVLGLPAGAWIDRLSPRWVMLTANLLSALALLSLPIAWRGGWITLPQVVVVALLLGTASMFFRTAYAKFIPAIVSKLRLEQANSRLLGTEAAMQLTGQGTAGYLIEWLGSGLGFLVNIATFVVSALCLGLIRPPHGAISKPLPPVQRSLNREIKEGLNFVWQDPYLRTLMLIGAVSNFGLTGYGTLFVLYLKQVLGLNGSEIGLALMLSSTGGLLGAILASVLAKHFKNGRLSTFLFLCSGLPALVIGLPTLKSQVPLTVLGGALVGVAVVAGNVIRSSWRQRYVPSELLGRVATTSSTLNFGLMPVGALVAGWLGNHYGIRVTIILMTAIHFLASWSVLVTPLARLKELPERD